MGAFVAEKVVKLMIQNDLKIKGSKAPIIGITFKENYPDVRNTKVVDIYHALIEFEVEVGVYDPRANIDEVGIEYGISLQKSLHHSTKYQVIIVAVAHNQFIAMNLSDFLAKDGVI